MGSFNVTCSISQVSIGYLDPIVYFPLIPNRYREYQIGDGNNQLIGTGCFYSPATLPLFGQYDDYGGIEIKSIVMDEHTSFLQEAFGCPLSSLVLDSRADLTSRICSGMFVHREIYDLLIQDQISEYGQKETSRANFEKDYEVYRTSLIASAERRKEWGLDFDFDASDTSGNIFGLKGHPFLKELYRSCFLEGKFKQQFIDLMLFETAMYTVNAFYFPAMNGCQGGNPYMSKRLYRKALEIVNKEIKERKK